ncbi:MAG: glycosyltransferase family 2 protein [Desulfatibacillaceae bacterium]
MPMFSAIIPVYNREWCIARAVESVLAQTHPDFECVVVDDGSTDATADVLAGFEGITVVSQPNRGVSSARNAGARAASGRYLAFLDSDDWWLPEKLAAQARYFEANPDSLICQCQETWYRNGKRRNPKRRHEKPAGDIFERSLELCLVSPSAVAMHRDLFHAVGGFDESLPACEDYDLWLRVGARHPVGLVDEALVVRTGGHQDQLSALPGLDAWRVAALVKLLEDGGLGPRRHGMAVRVLKRKCAVYAGGCEKRGRHEEAARYRELASRYSSGI